MYSKKTEANSVSEWSSNAQEIIDEMKEKKQPQQNNRTSGIHVVYLL